MSSPFAVELERRRAGREAAPAERPQTSSVARAAPAAVAGAAPPNGGEPESPFRAELARRTRPQVDPLAAGTQEFSRELVSHVVNLPGVALETLARGLRGAGIDSPVSRIEPGQLEVEPEQLQAAVGTVDLIARHLLRGERPDPSALFEEQLEAFRGAREARREEAPVATGLGRVAADAATLATGRLPLVRLRQALPAIRFESASQPTAMRRTVARLLERPAVARILRGTGRTAETGLEGATLAILDRDDPAETALYSAGAQTAGSLSLEALRQMREHPIAASVFLTGATIQILKESTPGGRDRILESLETAAAKVPHLIALGGLAGAAGTGRVRGAFAADWPKFADAVTAAPRGAMISLLKELAGEEERGSDEVRVAIDAYHRDPSFFGEAARGRLARAIEDPDRSVRTEVSRLLRSKENRQRLARAREELAAAQAQAQQQAEASPPVAAAEE